MGVIQRQSSWATVITYVGVVIGYLNVAILIPNFMKPEDLGLRSTLIGFSGIIAHMAQLGVTQTLVKYYPYYKDNSKHKRQFLFFIFFVPFIPILILFGVIYFNMGWITGFYDENAEKFSQFFYLVYPLSFIMLYQGILEFYARVLRKIVVTTLIREILMKGSFAVLVLAFAFDWVSYHLFWNLYIGSFFLATIILIIYLMKLGEIQLQPGFSFLSKEKFKEIRSYSLFGYLSGFSGELVNYIDVLMISAFVNEGFTGVYAIGVFISNIIDIPRKAISQVAVSLISEANKDNDIIKLKEIYTKTSLNQTIVGLGMFMIIWLNIDSIFHLIPNHDKYLSAKFVILFISIARLVNMIAGVNGEIVQYSKYFRFNLYTITILGVLAFFTNYFLISWFGEFSDNRNYDVSVKYEFQIIGVAIATAFSIIAFNVARTIYVLRKMNIQPFTINTVKVLSWFLLTFMLINQIYLEFDIFKFPVLNQILSIGIRSLLIVILFGGGVIFFKFSSDINNFVSKLTKGKIK